eukprot:947785-Prorocentrum_minimum.AAC.1
MKKLLNKCRMQDAQKRRPTYPAVGKTREKVTKILAVLELARFHANFRVSPIPPYYTLGFGFEMKGVPCRHTGTYLFKNLMHNTR